MHFLETMTALNEGKTVTRCSGWGGQRFGQWRIRDHKLEFRRDDTKEWERSKSPLGDFVDGAYVLVGPVLPVCE